MARLFEVLETPEPGWTTRKLESRRTVDNPMEWHVELIREEDGACVTFRHEDLYIAWVRAVESAHSLNIQLDQEQS